jgi:hypothetical protein
MRDQEAAPHQHRLDDEPWHARRWSCRCAYRRPVAERSGSPRSVSRAGVCDTDNHATPRCMRLTLDKIQFRP